MSDAASNDFHFRVQPGILSAVFFILFDLVLLAIIDIVLSRIVCAIYYRKINGGEPIHAKSVDIPGITTYMLGKLWSIPNIIALSVKLGFLACILVIDLSIDAETYSPRATRSTRAVFRFDPSDAEWTKERLNKTVGRRWERVNKCRLVSSSNATFYALAFTLKNKTVDIEDEVGDSDDIVYDIDDSSVWCLREGSVLSEDVKVIARISGCSQVMGATSCSNAKKIEKETDLSLSFNFGSVLVGERDNQVPSLFWSLDANVSKGIFPEYPNPRVGCLALKVGYLEEDMRMIRACLVTSIQNGETIFDHWEFDQESGILTRTYPGPVFETELNYSDYQRISILKDVLRVRDWITLSGVIVADAVVYQKEDLEFTTLGAPETRTKISRYAIGLAAAMVVVAIVSRIFVAFTIGKDVRPQVNTINGLSSIAREESEPTGRSYRHGQGMLLGLSHRHGGHTHLGPLRSRDEMVRVTDGAGNGFGLEQSGMQQGFFSQRNKEYDKF